MVFQETANPGGRGIFQPGDGDMGGKFSSLRFQAKSNKTGLDATLQVQQAIAWPQPDPDHSGPASGREKTDPVKLKGELIHSRITQPLLNVLKHPPVHLADKTQGQMQLFRPHPAGAGQAAT